MNLTKKQLAEAKKVMRREKENYIDYTTNEVDYTSLTEAVANELDLYEERVNYTIPEELFELATILFPEH